MNILNVIVWGLAFVAGVVVTALVFALVFPEFSAM